VTMKARVIAAVGIVAVVSGIADVLSAQAPGNPAFEVASVKPNKSGDPTFSYFDAAEPGRYTAVNVSLRTLLREAYELQNFQLAGGPSWQQSDRFDIVAKGQGDLPPAQTLLMLRTLLAERFNLIVHHETQQQAVYTLMVARSDGRLGQHLHQSEVDCIPPHRPLANDGPLEVGQQCGFWYTPGGHALGRAVTLDEVAVGLSGAVGRVVLNRTGLTGTFDLDLDFTLSRSSGIADAATTRRPAPADSGASIFTALQEQLGLKLESTKGPVDVLVIDHAEQPSPD
jgi:uncharacterized protein (TIGR03435 family)